MAGRIEMQIFIYSIDFRSKEKGKRSHQCQNNQKLDQGEAGAFIIYHFAFIIYHWSVISGQRSAVSGHFQLSFIINHLPAIGNQQSEVRDH
jgi:hypothetical protein